MCICVFTLLYVYVGIFIYYIYSISPKLIHHLSSLFTIIVGYTGYEFNNLISLIFFKCIILIEN